MRPTIIAIRDFDIGKLHFVHGQEIAPGILPDDTVNKLIDQKRVKESDRRSLYKMFHRFTGCEEQEPLSKDEIATYTLPA